MNNNDYFKYIKLVVDSYLREYQITEVYLSLQHTLMQLEILSMKSDANSESYKVVINNIKDELEKNDYIEKIVFEDQLKRILFDKLNIYKKYRNYYSMNSIAEYFESGRCHSLEGPNGAYNLFELENRLDNIALGVSECVARLDEIKNTNKEIADELQKISRYTQSITKDIDSLVDLSNESLRIATDSLVKSGHLVESINNQIKALKEIEDFKMLSYSEMTPLGRMVIRNAAKS